MEQQDRWSRQAEEEIGRLTADPSLEPQHNMIAKALGEVARTLSPNGLLMWDRASGPYVEYAAQLGLEVVHREVDWNDIVLRGYGKPTELHYATLFRKVPLAERQAPQN